MMHTYEADDYEKRSAAHVQKIEADDTDEENLEEGEKPFREHVKERIDFLKERLAAEEHFQVTIAGDSAGPMMGHGVAQAQWREAGLADAYISFVNYLDRKLLQLQHAFPDQVQFGRVNGKYASHSHYHVWGANAWNWNLDDGEKIVGGGQAKAFKIQKEGVYGIVTSAKHGPPNGDIDIGGSAEGIESGELRRLTSREASIKIKQDEKDLRKRRRSKRKNENGNKNENDGGENGGKHHYEKNKATSDDIRRNLVREEMTKKLKDAEDKQLNLAYFYTLPMELIRQRLQLNQMEDSLLELYEEEIHRRGEIIAVAQEVEGESGSSSTSGGAEAKSEKKMDGLETYDMKSNSHYVDKFGLDSSAMQLYQRGKLKLDYAKYMEVGLS